MQARDHRRVPDAEQPWAARPKAAAPPVPGQMLLAARGAGASAASLGAWQHLAGNRAVTGMVQRELHEHGSGCGHHNAAEESGPAAPVHRQTTAHQVLRGSGTSIAGPLRQEMEARLGAAEDPGGYAKTNRKRKIHYASIPVQTAPKRRQSQQPESAPVSDKRPTRWRDDDYAAALNSLPPGNLPKKRDGVNMTLDGQDVTVPFGQWLANMRSNGRKTELGQELTAALQRHNLTPYQDAKGTWKSEPTRTRMTWRDDDYTAALNSLPPGNPPKQHDGVNMTLDGQDVTVPLGHWLANMRSNGRQAELDRN